MSRPADTSRTGRRDLRPALSLGATHTPPLSQATQFQRPNWHLPSSKTHTRLRTFLIPLHNTVQCSHIGNSSPAPPRKPWLSFPLAQITPPTPAFWHPVCKRPVSQGCSRVCGPQGEGIRSQSSQLKAGDEVASPGSIALGVCSSTVNALSLRTEHRQTRGVIFNNLAMSLYVGALMLFGAIILNLVPSSMLLRAIHSTSGSSSDRRDNGSSLSAGGPEAGRGMDMSPCSETQESPIGDRTMQRVGQAGARFIDSQHHNEEVSNGPDLTPTDARFQQKATLGSCKQNLCDISLLKDPCFCIFTWSLLFSQLAYMISTFHLVARAKTLGIDMMDASYLIAAAGKQASCSLTLGQANRKVWLVFHGCLTQ